MPRARPFRFALALLALLVAGAMPRAFAATVDFGVNPAIIELGETAMVTITVQGAGRAAPPGALPVPEGLQVVGQRQNMQFGPSGSVMSFHYEVAAKHEGPFLIGPFTYKVGAESFELPARKLEVRPASAVSKQGEAKISDVLFIELTASKPSVVTQEPFDLTLSLYSHPKVNLSDDFSLQNMEITGLKFGQWQRMQTVRETRDGQLWNVRRFLAQARPLSTGRFTMRPGLQVQVLVPRRDPLGDSFFDLAGFGVNEARAVLLQAAQETVVEVTDAPAAGKPADFAGAVGSFQFHADATPTEVTAGDPVTLRVGISGRGNLDSVNAPEPALDARFKAYETKSVGQELNEAGTAGKKMFEKVVIPLSAEVDRIPELSFSYFDPDTRAYRTVKAGPFPLKVRANSNAVSRVVSAPSPAPAGGSKSVVGEDIVYLKPAPAALVPAGELNRPALSPAGWCLQALPLALLGAAHAVARHRRRRENDVGYARRMEAPRHAREGIARARAAAAAGDAAAFHAAVWQALSGYFANRLNVGPGEVSPTLLRERLGGSEAGRAVAERAAEVIERCEAARFGGGASGNLAELLAGAETLLRDAEKVRGA